MTPAVGGRLPKHLSAFVLLVVANTCCSSGALAAGALATAREGTRTWGGSSYNAPTYDEAERRALARCSENGPGCRVVAFFSRKCLAVAVQQGTGGSGWATRATIAEAQESVMNNCLSHGRPCTLKLAVCDSVGVQEAPQSAPAPAPPAPPAQRSTPTAAPSAPRSRGCELYPELCQ
jgi:hypothetical protein